MDSGEGGKVVSSILQFKCSNRTVMLQYLIKWPKIYISK